MDILTTPAPIQSSFGTVQALARDLPTGKFSEQILELEMSPVWQRWITRLQMDVSNISEVVSAFRIAEPQ